MQAVRESFFSSIGRFAGTLLLVNVVGLVGEALTGRARVARLACAQGALDGATIPLAWAFFAFAGAGNLVYVIGRLVISRRRGGAVGGLVAALVVVAVVLMVGAIVFGVVESAQAIELIRDAARRAVTNG